MIRLFRKIRTQLLSEDRYISYFLYASGEIMLVMIGILLALQLNNWNERRKERNAGDELASKLYEELMVTYEDSKNAYLATDRQIRYIDLVLAQGKNLNVDSLLSVSNEEYLFVRLFTFPSYVLSFIEYFAPNMQVYESSRNDGSIKYVTHEDLVNTLEFIHIDVNNRLTILYEREIATNENIEEYITAKYGHLFEDNLTTAGGLWNEETTEKLLQILTTDGSLRYKLQQKSSRLKRKRAHLQHRILPSIEKVLANRETSE